MTRIDIVSGFLGAGKTTLIKKLLDESFKGQKIVLIENEFGEIGIDSGFLKEAGVQITEMNSGCICCSLVGDFGEALKQVVTEYAPDRVIIEPSGVGKLSDVTKAVIDASNVVEMELGSSVAVVDGPKCKIYLKNFGEFFVDQVQYAGAILLSRTQTMKAEKVEAVVEMLREHNEKAPIITTPWDQITGDQILAALEGHSLADELLEEVKNMKHHHHDHGEECSCGHHHDHEEHECHCGHHHDHEEHECCCGHHHDHEEHECSCGHHHDHEEHECSCGHHHDHEEHECHCGHHHDHEEHECSCGHHHDHEEHECSCGHHHDHEEHECSCGHHHDHEEHECSCGHHHDHGDSCSCGHDHHHHHADEVFTSWGYETASPFTAEELNHILEELDDSNKYGMVLRAKGIVPAADGTWFHFDYTPGEAEIRTGAADYTGRLCVIGSKIKEQELKALFDRK